jgi:Crinkler effector protein N-terminal domain
VPPDEKEKKQDDCDTQTLRTSGSPFRYTLFSCLSPQMKLTCLILGDTNCIARVEIDDNDIIADLKKLIKQECAHMLHNIDAFSLNLWKCSIPADDKLQETLNSICFDICDDRLDHLSPLSLVSKHFMAGLSPETIHILVQLPQLGEYGTCISYSTTKECFYGMPLGLTAVPMTETASLDPNLGTAEVYSGK